MPPLNIPGLVMPPEIKSIADSLKIIAEKMAQQYVTDVQFAALTARVYVLERKLTQFHEKVFSQCPNRETPHG